MDMLMLIRIVAAALLLLGSGLIFRALLEIDAALRPAARPRPGRSESGSDLRRAA
jgi:hypothetical protein